MLRSTSNGHIWWPTSLKMSNLSLNLLRIHNSIALNGINSTSGVFVLEWEEQEERKLLKKKIENRWLISKCQQQIANRRHFDVVLSTRHINLNKFYSKNCSKRKGKANKHAYEVSACMAARTDVRRYIDAIVERKKFIISIYILTHRTQQ